MNILFREVKWATGFWQTNIIALVAGVIIGAEVSVFLIDRMIIFP